jgi:23S rRNA (adenine2503-C2)-methyltransferase
MKICIKNLNKEALKKALSDLSDKSYVIDNIFRAIYQRGIKNFSDITDVSKDLRLFLNNNYEISKLNLVKKEISKKDTCVKFLFSLQDGETIESVLIPHKNRLTACISTQVGCKMNCDFCVTARQGFTRNLSTSEIVNQVLYLNDYAREVMNKKVDSSIRGLTNIVYMGMGEPLDNLENVIKSVDIISDDNSLGFGKRKITVSTSGLVDKIKIFKESCNARLAISLNAPNDEKRNQIMPINKKNPIKEIIKTIKDLKFNMHNFVTIEYVLFKGFNDAVDDAKCLALLLKGLPIKLNIIPFNEYKYSKYHSPNMDTVSKFYDLLAKEGIVCNVRHSKGTDISAACGQLKSKDL